MKGRTHSVTQPLGLCFCCRPTSPALRRSGLQLAAYKQTGRGQSRLFLSFQQQEVQSKMGFHRAAQKRKTSWSACLRPHTSLGCSQRSFTSVPFIRRPGSLNAEPSAIRPPLVVPPLLRDVCRSFAGPRWIAAADLRCCFVSPGPNFEDKLALEITWRRSHPPPSLPLPSGGI